MQRQQQQHDPWSNWSPPTQRPTWKIPRNNTEGLVKVDGRPQDYKNWHNRIRDHAADEWPHWRQILDHAARFPVELTPAVSSNMYLHGVNAWELSADLGSFLLKWVGPHLYAGRMQTGQQIEGNWLELWRMLHVQHSGSDKLVQIAGRAKLQYVHACTQVCQLDQHVEHWLYLFYEFGEVIGAEHAKTMFIRTLPAIIRTEIYRRPEVERLELIPLIDWVRHQTMYEEAEELIAQHLKPERVSSLTRAPARRRERDQAPPHDPEAPPVAAVQPRPEAKAKAKAKSSARPARTQAEWDRVKAFNGCYHCGKPDHARTENKKLGLKGCPGFKALKRQYGGLPPNYKGTHEAYFEAKTGKVRPLTSLVEDDPAASDYAESDMSYGDISPGQSVPCTSLTNGPALPEWPEASRSSSQTLSKSLRRTRAPVPAEGSAPEAVPVRRQRPSCQSTSRMNAAPPLVQAPTLTLKQSSVHGPTP